MRQGKVPAQAPGIGRLGTTAAWISAGACLPYLVLKVGWTLDLPLGITDRSVLHDSGWVAGNAIMGALQLAGLLIVLALTRPWARRVPMWLLLVPVWVGTGLLFEVTVGAALTAVFSRAAQSSGDGIDYGAFHPWVFTVVYASFAVQGVALATAFACYVRTRWGRLLGERTGRILARRTATARSWRDRHLEEMAAVVAVMAVGVAAVCAYWAAGGTFGLSTAQPHLSSAVHVSRAAGAVTAAAGLLALSGNWGRRSRFWLPAALVWLGSGALVAFDGLSLVANRLLPGLDGSTPAWSVQDSILTAKALIGLLTAAIGAVAVTAAANGSSSAKATRSSPAPSPSTSADPSASGGSRPTSPASTDPDDSEAEGTACRPAHRSTRPAHGRSRGFSG